MDGINRKAFLIFLTAFIYYVTLSAKEWTWVFVSFDSGDWLTASTIWMVPQPYGSPLYILLGHFLNLFPGDLVIKMTILLSALPSAITVSLVYLIVTKLNLGSRIAIVSSMALLGCSIFLSQSTVLEEYAIATMFVTLAFYFYISDNKKLTMLSLALGTAIHIIVLPITVLWIVINYKELRSWLKPIAIYIPIVICFYALIAYLMYANTPKYIAGNLTLGAINAYLGSTGTIGRISLVETPQRLWEAACIIIYSLGLAIIPLSYGFKKPYNNKWIIIIFLTTIFCLWLYITNTDMTTWTFLIFCIPIATIGIAVGLSRLPKWCITATLIGALALIVSNSFLFNANILTKNYSDASKYYQAMQEIPENSCVALPRGGGYGLGLLYAISQGQELTPIFMQKEEGWNNQGYLDYIEWTIEHEQIGGSNWIKQIHYCLLTFKEVYIAYDVQPPEWQEEIDQRFVTEEYNNYFRRITSEL